MKDYVVNSRGSVLIETVFVITGALLPILLVATGLASVMDSQNRLELINREAGRMFMLAASNSGGATELALLESRHRAAGFPIQLQLRCLQDCAAGTRFELIASQVTTVFDLPFIPDLDLTLRTSLTATIDRYVER